VVAAAYVPHRGDLVWIDFDPQAGHEQSGRRPALILSDKLYNARSSLAIIVPITSRDKGYPFQVALPANALPKPSWAIADQVSSLDWRARNAELIRRAPAAIVEEVSALAVGLVEGRR
jgi:mRNA interferase MazF